MAETHKKTEEKTPETPKQTAVRVEESVRHVVRHALHPTMTDLWLSVLGLFVLLGSGCIIFSTIMFFSLFRSGYDGEVLLSGAPGLDKREVLDARAFVDARAARFEEVRINPPRFIDPS